MLVADELRGIQGGGLGTVFTYLAIALARLGNAVDVLYFGRAPAAIEPAWAEVYDRWGVSVKVLAPTEARVDPAHFARLLDIDGALAAAQPEVVIAQDLAGAAYVPLRRRQLGLGFEDTLFIVRCSGTRRWITDAARKVAVHPGALAVTVLEQAALELADIVVAESRYMVGWMKNQGWRLPDATHVIPSLLESAATGESLPMAQVDPGGARRLVFFGRLEERKGLRPFVAALNELEPELLDGIDLEFLGPPTPAWPPARVRKVLSPRARRALGTVQFTTGLGRTEALARLARPGSLAVMPSLEDNSPSTVYECLELGVPFIASSGGGTPELIAPADRARVLFAPTPEGIAEALGRMLSDPAEVRAARPAFDAAALPQYWADLVRKRPTAKRMASERPQVDVVITGEEPGVCLDALARGSYENFEASPAEDRTSGLHRGRSPWVIFLDGHDIPAADFLETLVQAQAASGADVVTCGLALEAGDGRSTSALFLGEPRGLEVLSNRYGTAALIRRSLLADCASAFRPDEADPDWPLLAHLKAAGAQIVSIPLPLVRGVRLPGDLERDAAAAAHVVREIEALLPPVATSLARLAAGLAGAVPTVAEKPDRDNRTVVLGRLRRWVVRRAPAQRE